MREIRKTLPNRFMSTMVKMNLHMNQPKGQCPPMALVTVRNGKVEVKEKSAKARFR
jgi:hypothetical protein